jgi:hypothetical protein
MVGQVIAGTVVKEAGNSGSFIDQALKLITVVAIIASITIIAIVLFVAFNIYEALGGVIGSATGLFDFFLNPFRLAGNGAEFLFGGITGFASNFFGRR